MLKLGKPSLGDTLEVLDSVDKVLLRPAESVLP